MILRATALFSSSNSVDCIVFSASASSSCLADPGSAGACANPSKHEKTMAINKNPRISRFIRSFSLPAVPHETEYEIIGTLVNLHLQRISARTQQTLHTMTPAMSSVLIEHVWSLEENVWRIGH